MISLLPVFQHCLPVRGGQLTRQHVVIHQRPAHISVAENRPYVAPPICSRLADHLCQFRLVSSAGRTQSDPNK